MIHSKRFRALAQSFEPLTLHPLDKALALVKANATAKFDESVDISIKLGIDAKKTDQLVSGTVSLPNGTGKKVRVLVFAKGDKQEEARAAGADEVGFEDLVEKIQGGWMDFDVAIATPDMMGVVGRLGKLLGPRGLMPNPKSGTVTFDLASAARDAKAGKIESRVDRAGILHAPIGKASFDEGKLVENLHVESARRIVALAEAIEGRDAEAR